MRKLFSFAAKALMVLAMGATASTTVLAEIIDVGPHESVYGGNVRGFWFTAPTNFVITGLGVPTDASSADFNVAVVRHNTDTPWPEWANTTNDFTTLHLSRSNPGTSLIAVNIPVYTGEVIGILGSRADLTSYGSAPYASSIGGIPVTLGRFGMQFPLSSTDPTELWIEPGGSIGRVQLELTVVDLPNISLDTTSLDFGDVLTNQASSTMPVTLTNSGTANLDISSIVASGGFAQTNDCGSTLGASLSCTINVTLTPTAASTYNGLITINSNARTSPDTIILTGVGYMPLPVPTISALGLGILAGLFGIIGIRRRRMS